MIFNWPEGKEAKTLIERYRNGERSALCDEIGCKIRTLRDVMANKYGVKASEQKQDVHVLEPEQKVYPATEIKIKPIKQESQNKEGEEVHCQPISDAHSGLITPTFNSKVLRRRLEYLFDRTFKFCSLHRKMRPIKKLWVPFLGDMTHGEQYGRQGFVEEFEMGAEQQIYELLVPVFSNLFVNALQVYEEIYITGVPGNHGNIQPRSQTLSKRSNWDTIFYRALAQSLSNYKRITLTMPEVGDWFLVTEMNGWRFLQAHGDQIISYQGIPFYGLEKRALRWKQSIGVDQPFDYMMTAHVHNPNFLTNAGVPTFVNGCIISDSKFPLNRMGLKDVPQQWSFFINKRFGVTASYRVNLEPIT